MKLDVYESIEDLPVRMVTHLYRAESAEDAERVFHTWRDKGVIVPAKIRADIWIDASEFFHDS